MSSWWSGHKILDPSELEARFAVEDGMAFMDSVVHEGMSDEGSIKMERVRAVLDQIPPREADFIDLYYFKNIKQTDIATIFGVSQPTVCYRLQRAASRIQFLLSLPDLDAVTIEKDVATLLDDPTDVKIMVGMFLTTCQSEVAKQLGVTQGFVRHRFIRSIAKMKGQPGFDLHVKLFERIAENLNILREVQRPMWGMKMSCVLL